MPLIRIEFDDNKVSKDETMELTHAIQKIVSEATGIEDVFIYANSAQIKYKVAPIEIFVEMSAEKIKNLDELFGNVKDRVSKWKKESGFKHPINLTVIPMNWKVGVGI